MFVGRWKHAGKSLDSHLGNLFLVFPSMALFVRGLISWVVKSAQKNGRLPMGPSKFLGRQRIQTSRRKWSGCSLKVMDGRRREPTRENNTGSNVLTTKCRRASNHKSLR